MANDLAAMLKAQEVRNEKLKALFKNPTHKGLFTRIRVSDYADCPENLYCDGECGIIKIGRSSYRYYHDSVDELHEAKK